MEIQKVALVGASGILGTAILDGLMSAGFDVTVIKRTSSTSNTVDGDAIAVRKVPDDLPLQALTEAMAGQDAAVACFPMSDEEQHVRVAEAAAAARVRRYVPADFGSVNADNAQARAQLTLYEGKMRVLDAVKKLAAGSESFTWTSIVCGHFFCPERLKTGLHIDVASRTADVLDGGDYRASASTPGRIAEAVVQVLRRAGEDKTRNRVLFVQSFCATQRDVVAALERATGGASWKTRRINSDMFVRVERAKLAAGDGNALEELVWVLGTKQADWTKRDDFAMKLLGLVDEDLDKVVADAVGRTR